MDVPRPGVEAYGSYYPVPIPPGAALEDAAKRLANAMKTFGIVAVLASDAVQSFNEALPVAEEAGKLVCRNCGATCEPNERNRFLKRHPAKCEAKKKEAIARGALAKSLAAGTRSVDEDWPEGITPGDPEDWADVLPE